jgi:hypothetical protein
MSLDHSVDLITHCGCAYFVNMTIWLLSIIQLGCSVLTNPFCLGDAFYSLGCLSIHPSIHRYVDMIIVKTVHILSVPIIMELWMYLWDDV